MSHENLTKGEETKTPFALLYEPNLHDFPTKVHFDVKKMNVT
jgi:hypothetical protein